MAITASQLRFDLKCGSGYIAKGKKCHKGVGAPSNIAQAPVPPSPKPDSSRGRRLAIGAAVAGTVALGAGLAISSSRKQILNTPDVLRRAAQKGVTEVVHRATSPKPSMKFTSRSMNEVNKEIKKRSFKRKVMLTVEAARRKQEPGYRKPPLQLTAGLIRKTGTGKKRTLLRTALLTMEAARRKQEPGYRKAGRKDAWVGNDKKLKCGPGSKPCGNACIPKNHKCRASWNKPVKALKAGAALAGVGLVGTALFHKRANMRAAAAGLGEPVMHGGFALGNIALGNKAQAAKNAVNAMMSAKNFKKNVVTLGKGYGQDVSSAYAAAKKVVFKARHHRQAKGQ